MRLAVILQVVGALAWFGVLACLAASIAAAFVDGADRDDLTWLGVTALGLIVVRAAASAVAEPVLQAGGGALRHDVRARLAAAMTGVGAGLGARRAGRGTGLRAGRGHRRPRDRARPVRPGADARRRDPADRRGRRGVGGSVVGRRAPVRRTRPRRDPRDDRPAGPRAERTTRARARLAARAHPGHDPRAADPADVRPQRRAGGDDRGAERRLRAFLDGRPAGRLPVHARPGVGRDRGDRDGRDRDERPRHGRRARVRTGAAGAPADARVLPPAPPALGRVPRGDRRRRGGGADRAAARRRADPVPGRRLACGGRPRRPAIAVTDVVVAYDGGSPGGARRVLVRRRARGARGARGPDGRRASPRSRRRSWGSSRRGRARSPSTGRRSAMLELEGWRRQVAWVPQHPTIFHGSVADNLRLARPEADDDRLRWAAEATGAASFFASLPDGYATLRGGGGRPSERGTAPAPRAHACVRARRPARDLGRARVAPGRRGARRWCWGRSAGCSPAAPRS